MEHVVLSAEQIAEAKRLAALRNPASKRIQLDEIELTEHSLANKTIVIKNDGQDVEVRVTEQFIRDLAKVLNINIKLQSTLNSDKEYGQQMLTALMNGLKVFKAQRDRDRGVTIVGDLGNMCFTNIIGGSLARISNEGIFEVAEELQRQYPGLQLIEAKVPEIGNTVMIKLLAPNPVELVGDSKETFNFGLTLSNSNIHTFVGDFAYRLVCLNGMMGMKSENNFKLKDVSTNGLLDMHSHLNLAASRRFMPLDFEENIIAAQEVYASLAELEEAYEYVKHQLNCPEDMRETYQIALLRNHFSDLAQAWDRLKKKGVRLEDLDRKKKQYINSGMKMWDLINVITFLGSNSTGFDFVSKDKLQLYGGKLMTKQADLKFMNLMNL
jgi:flagellin-specific chaperone FliS